MTARIPITIVSSGLQVESYDDGSVTISVPTDHKEIEISFGGQVIRYAGERGPASQGGPFPTIQQADYWRSLDPKPDWIELFVESNRPYGVVELRWIRRDDRDEDRLVYVDPAGQIIRREKIEP